MRIGSIFLIAAIVCGCSFVQPYRNDIPQGNLVTREMLAQIEVGMTRDQVEFALGHPVLDPFMHPDDWVYYYQPDAKSDATQLIRLHFEQNILKKIQGDARISETEL